MARNEPANLRRDVGRAHATRYGLEQFNALGNSPLRIDGFTPPAGITTR